MSALRAAFVDTGAWIAPRYGRDQHYGRAQALRRRLRDEGMGLVTTEWVVTESVTLLKARGDDDFARAGFGAFR